MLLTRRKLLKAVTPALIGLAAPSLILPKSAPAFWQSRDSNYNKSVGGSVAPTVLHLTAPNDFQNAAWTYFSATCGSNAQISPTGSADASIINATTTGGFSAARQTLPITLVSGTHYSLSGWIKHNTPSGPVWVEFVMFDGVSSEVHWWVDATSAAGAAGTTGVVGPGAVVDAGFAVTFAGNNYSKVDLFFSFTSTPTAANLIDIRPVDSNGGTSPTNGQGFFVWGWGA